MDDLSWILADGESLEDALEDFTAEVKKPELLKARQKRIKDLSKAGKHYEKMHREAWNEYHAVIRGEEDDES